MEVLGGVQELGTWGIDLYMFCGTQEGGEFFWRIYTFLRVKKDF